MVGAVLRRGPRPWTRRIGDGSATEPAAARSALRRGAHMTDRFSHDTQKLLSEHEEDLLGFALRLGHVLRGWGWPSRSNLRRNGSQGIDRITPA